LPDITEVDPIEKYLTNLDDGQLLELFSFVEKFEDQKQNDPLSIYLPNDIQREFHDSDAIIRFLFGGNMSGKTYAGFKELCCHLLEYDPSGTTPETRKIMIGGKEREVPRYGKHPLYKHMPKVFWFGAVKMSKAKSMYEQDLRRMIPPGEFGRYDNYNERLYMKNGNILQLMSYESDIRMWQSDAIDGIFLDEQPPFLHFKESRSRVNRKSGLIWCAMTPLYAHSAWTFREIWQKSKDDKNIVYHIMDLDHNIHLDEAQKDAQKSAFAGTEEEDSRIHGRFTILRGVIHPLFNEQTHVIPPFKITEEHRKEYEFCRVIDLHPRNECVCQWFMYRDGYDPIIYEIEEYDLMGGQTDLFADEVNRMTDKMNIEIAFNIIDTPEAKESPSRRDFSMRRVLREKGIAGINANRNHGAGVMRLNEYIKEDKFFIFSTCRKSINSIMFHMWDDYKGIVADEKNPKETWKRKDDHWIRSCHFMALKMPALNTTRLEHDIMQRGSDEDYLHYFGGGQQKNYMRRRR